ncbi:MAG: molybdate ABC transporter substrate-binding protein [Planctomycetes bacterium]|nr:molybdate ABC transporter substrate-binding protein [Planctomycetota bacterium]
MFAIVRRTRPAWLACVVVASSCSRAADSTAATGAAGVELVVYAATSTRDAFQALEADYERSHAVDLVFNFGSSGDLAKQIVAARKADVFLSAGEKELDEVAAAGLVIEGTRRPLLTNQLVVIEPSALESLFTEPFEPAQLADARVEHLSLAHTETVPAGRYAKAWLEKIGVWPQVASRVVPGVDVRAALAAVESGAARAGLVYRTDAALSKRARIVFAVPLAQGPRIVYPLAVLGGPAGRPHEAEALAFAAWLATSDGLASFEARGFLPLAASERAK